MRSSQGRTKVDTSIATCVVPAVSRRTPAHALAPLHSLYTTDMYSTPMLLYMIDFFVPDDIYAVMHYMLYETDNFDAPDDLNYLYYGNTFPTGLFQHLYSAALSLTQVTHNTRSSSSNSTSSMWHNHAVLTEESCCCCCVCCNGVVAAGAFVWWWVAVPRGSVCGGGLGWPGGGLG